MDSKSLFRKYGAYVVAAIVFIAAALLYCKPVLSGKVILAADAQHYEEASHEAQEYARENGEGSWWTSSMFCGMPNYQIGGGAQFKSVKALGPVNSILHKCIYSPVWAFIFYFGCFFILLLAFGISPWMSLFGALVMGLSSYFITLIPAGHNTKIASIALTAVVFAGYKFIFDKKYVLGAALVMVFTASGYALHPQAFYYYFLMIGLLWIAELWKAIKEKKYKDLALATGIFVVAVGIGIGTGCSGVLANSEYAAESIRGGSALAPYKTDSTATAKPSKGLNVNYATKWCYGIDETLSLLIPGVKGGASQVTVPENSAFGKDLKRRGYDANQVKTLSSSFPMYWGDQPMTMGNVYVGAIICFLFLLGLFVVKGPYKWMLLLCTVFSILLSWGSHFMPLTKLFFNFFPLYSKFRTVSTILIVAEIAMPLLGFMALKEILEGKVEKQRLVKSIYISGGITAGICLVVAILGISVFNFTGSADSVFFADRPDWLMKLVRDQRKSLLLTDCFRSFVFVILGAGALLLFAKEKLKGGIVLAIVGILSVVDLWGVDRRYLNDSNFVTPSKKSDPLAITEYEKTILKDPDPDFRVLNLAVKNPFSESRTSYYLKSVGGYSAAKLSRYQDIIDTYLATSSPSVPILSLLNTKYFIMKDPETEQIHVEENPYAMGHAWLVKYVYYSNDPKDDIESLTKVNPYETAVISSEFAPRVLSTAYTKSAGDNITLTDFKPDRVEYHSTTQHEALAVFSEIYYPHGWKAYIDGNRAAYFRADYLLRGMKIPAGDHKIVFEFKPSSVKRGDAIALVFIAIMYLSVIAAIAYGCLKLVKKKEE